MIVASSILPYDTVICDKALSFERQTGYESLSRTRLLPVHNLTLSRLESLTSGMPDRERLYLRMSLNHEE